MRPQGRVTERNVKALLRADDGPQPPESHAPLSALSDDVNETAAWIERLSTDRSRWTCIGTRSSLRRGAPHTCAATPASGGERAARAVR
jgi:hypothetical protein